MYLHMPTDRLWLEAGRIICENVVNAANREGDHETTTSTSTHIPLARNMADSTPAEDVARLFEELGDLEKEFAEVELDACP